MMSNGRLQLNGIMPVGGVSPDGDSGIDLMREGHAQAEDGDQRNERALLQKYMTENETLRYTLPMSRRLLNSPENRCCLPFEALPFLVQ